jgi:hypothetical protein
MDTIVQSESPVLKIIYSENDIRIVQSIEQKTIVFSSSIGSLVSIPEEKIVISSPIETHLHVYDYIGGFNSLADVPSSYIGKKGKVLIVNDLENGLEFGVIEGGGSCDIEDESITNIDISPEAGIELSKLENGDKLQELVSTGIIGYKISDMDDNGIVPLYYGFLSVGGKWYILREHPEGVFRYIKGDVEYETNWENRDSLVYNLYSIVFT